MRFKTLGRDNTAESQRRWNIRANKNKNRKKQSQRSGGSRSHRKIVPLYDSEAFLYTIIRPLIYIAQIFGLAPYKFTNKDKLIRMKPSNVKCLYSLLFCTVTYTYAIITLDINYAILRRNMPTIGITVTFKMIVNFAVLVTDLVLEVLRRERFARVCNSLMDFEVGNKSNGFLTKIKHRLLIFVITGVFAWISIILLSAQGFQQSYINMFLYTLNYFANFLGVFKLCGALFLVDQRFGFLNDVACSVATQGGKSVVAKKIEVSYNRLMNLSEKLNDMYSWSLFLFLFNLSCHSVISIYFIMVWIIVRNRNVVAVIGIFSWLVVYLIQLLLLHVTCHSVSLKANLMPQILLDCHRNDKRRNKQNVLRTTLHFLNRRLIFTAGGCFNVHLPLLTSISKLLMTYLVILLQLSNK